MGSILILSGLDETPLRTLWRDITDYLAHIQRIKLFTIDMPHQAAPEHERKAWQEDSKGMHHSLVHNYERGTQIDGETVVYDNMSALSAEHDGGIILFPQFIYNNGIAQPMYYQESDQSGQFMAVVSTFNLGDMTAREEHRKFNPSVWYNRTARMAARVLGYSTHMSDCDEKACLMHEKMDDEYAVRTGLDSFLRGLDVKQGFCEKHRTEAASSSHRPRSRKEED